MSDSQTIPIEVDQVIRYLQSMRDSGKPDWQRLQLVWALETYQATVLRQPVSSLEPIKAKLIQIAERERMSGAEATASPGIAGKLNPNEPELLRRTRAELRRMHCKFATEKAYIGWLKRFMTHCRSEDLGNFGKGEIKEVLSDLAVDRNVAPNTQQQAQSAL